MSAEIALRCGVRYVGPQRDRHGTIVGHIYNDDDGCGGSFCVPEHHDALDVAAALDKKREEFANAR